MKREGLIVIAAVTIIAMASGAFWSVTHRAAARADAPENTRAPQGIRVRVQVENGTKTRGLARKAMLLLRDRGFDVLELRTSSDGTDTTIVYDLTGHPDWAARVARVFTPARIETRPDPSRYLDVSVVLGSTWRPPAQPFYP